ncbi:MAG: FAD-dependent oxidoreductase [Bacteroidales bacterium]|nr:FAD-dependent oxidoreductase [Bacteroidales bacterium]
MKNIVVIGGGIAGVEVACMMAETGNRVTIIERDNKLGGKLNNWYCLFPDFKKSDEILNYIKNRISKFNIEVKLNSNVEKAERNGNTWLVHTENAICKADAVIIATGYQLFDATRKEELGYKIYDNVITQADMEQRFREGNFLTSYGKKPERIAIVHCVGSRDEKCHNMYCSKVCCVTGVKQAIEINKFLPDAQIFCFYMDLRMYDKFFEELYRTAQEQHNIQFIRGRVSEVSETPDQHLSIKTEDTLSGRPMKMKLDMVILLAGMETKKNTKEIADKFGVDREISGFLKSKDFHIGAGILTQKGVFAAGTCIAPMSIKETIENARSTAFQVNEYLKTL